jgi:acetylornithine deacetylase/succinyl-diaminopimelate desuccinylase-like protein
MNMILNVDTKKLMDDLIRLIRIPSVSARNQNLEECAKEVAQIMKEIGIDSELIYFDEGDKNAAAAAAPPIVYGEVKSKSNPNGKTILFYNHYDVQP